MTVVRSVLLHEQRIGHTDRATVGGLEAFWSTWLPSLRAIAADDARRSELAACTATLQVYATAEPTERARLLGNCLAALDRLGVVGPTAGSARVTGGPSGAQLPPSKAALRPSPSSGTIGSTGESGPGTRRQTAPRATTPAVARRIAAPAAGRSASELDRPVATLRGVGPANAVRLGKLGITTIRDLLYHFLTRHIDYRDTRPISALGDSGAARFQTIQATVVDVRVEPLRGRTAPGGQWMFADVPAPRAGRPGLLRITARLKDSSGTASAVWIRAQDFLSREFLPGRQVMLSGEIHQTWRGNELEFRDPDYEFTGRDDSLDSVHTGRLVPVYRLTQSLGARGLRRLLKLAVDAYAPLLADHLPAQTLRTSHLLDLPNAVSQMHFPDSPVSAERARRRLVFDEFFLIQYTLLERRRERVEESNGIPMNDSTGLVSRFVEGLPFTLTGAQSRALDDVLADVGRGKPMSRLVQGDVGSGKTVVAAGAALAAVAAGCQAAIMAPTAILAEQHFRTFSSLFKDAAVETVSGSRPVRVGLLIGSLSAKAKAAARQSIGAGEVDIVVGTQALIQESVEFRRLGLAVVDEQHRFGVLQRGALRSQGDDSTAHMLVMTATPIPRTLALTVYGDLDVSVIDELPPGRQEIRTKCFGPADRSSVYEGLRHEVRAGHQAYIICPLVEESEKLEAKAAVAEYDRLRSEVFPDLRLGLVHGKMKPTEKEAAMRAFQRGETQVLVATAVVEVGVDVSNATFMIIEGADRFGLAQLHQFRGRIGRGSARSYCALLADDASLGARERLETVAGTRDGFKLAEADLRLRGPGEFFGTRQSGLPDLKLARPGDELILEEANRVARELVANPDALSTQERVALLARVARLWQAGEQH